MYHVVIIMLLINIIMTSLISIAIEVSLNYFSISKSRVIFIATEFLAGGVL